MTSQYRQGDVLLIRIPEPSREERRQEREIPAEDGRVILAHGEATGHTHAIDASLATLFQLRDGQLYLRVTRQADLRHEEPRALALPPGHYRVVRQREFVAHTAAIVGD
jgi:hypothetical protein